MKSSDLFVKCLENEGVERIFGIAGEENLDLLDSLKKSEIKFITTRHEQAAAIMAATCGRLSGTPAVVLSTLGPGATNLVTGVAYAQLGAMPLIVITAQKSESSEDGIGFQRVDLVSLMEPITKSSSAIDQVGDIPKAVNSAFKIAQSDRPGVVHIEFPEDVAKKECSSEPLPKFELEINVADQSRLEKVAEIISEAHKPLVMFGGMASRNALSATLTEFIKSAGIPFFTTQLGKGAVNEHDKQFLGTASVSDGLPLHEIIRESDLIISIGYDSVEKMPFTQKDLSARIISINSYTDENLADILEFELVGDISDSIDRLSQLLIPKNYWKGSSISEFKLHQVKASVEDVRTLSSDLFGGGVDTADYKLDPYEIENVPENPEYNFTKIAVEQLIVALQSVISKNSILCLDNGLYKIDFTEKYRATNWNSILLDNSLATMGAGLPSAIAAKLLYPSSQVVAIVGDGGFMMNSQELETMVRLGLAVKIIVIDDNGFGMIRWKQQSEALAENGLQFGNPNWAKFAESFGVNYMELSDPDTLQTDLKKALQLRKSLLMHMSVDYSKFYTE